MLCFLNIVLLSLLCGFGANALLNPLVSIPSGTLQGYYDEATNGRRFAAFEGIPYARPPIGKYRFREPHPTKPWKGVWVANQTVKCIQYDHHMRATPDPVNGQEDCLFVNVYTPQLSQTSMLDVIVNIHGGAFIFGYGHMYGPKILMEKDVVYVNMNYRLGPLGFLSTEDDVVPGNNGLKDQAMALQWVKDNIVYFGGNPDSVMITGVSAGGASVTYHYLSPMSAGLFHRGIALSGAAVNPWALTENPLEKAKKLAASVGCDSVATRDMIDCMRWRPAKHLVRNVEKFMPFLYNPFSPFGPVVEKAPNMMMSQNKKHPVIPFITQNPYDILHQGKVNDAPLIMSFVEAEGLYPGAEFQADPSYLPEIEQRWEELAPFILDYNYTAPVTEHPAIAQKAKAYYLQDKPISQDTYNQLIQMIGDRLFVTTIETGAKLFARAMTSPVYLIYFTYRGVHSKSKLLSKKMDNYGTCHGDDLIYVVSQDWADPFQSESDKAMKDIMVNLWTSFAKTGVPDVPGVTPTPIAKTRGPLNYMHIESPISINVKSIDTLSHRQFWNSLPFNENQLTIHVKEEL